MSTSCPLSCFSVNLFSFILPDRTPPLPGKEMICHPSFIWSLFLWEKKQGIYLSFILSLFHTPCLFLSLPLKKTSETSPPLPVSPWENEHFVLCSFFFLSANHSFPFFSLSLKKDESLSSSLCRVFLCFFLLFCLQITLRRPLPSFVERQARPPSLSLSLSVLGVETRTDWLWDLTRAKTGCQQVMIET